MFKIAFQAATVVPFSAILFRIAVKDLEAGELPARLQAETMEACKSFIAQSVFRLIAWAILEIIEESADCLRSQTAQGDDGVVVVIGLAESDGGCGVQVGDYEVLQFGR